MARLLVVDDEQKIREVNARRKLNIRFFTLILPFFFLEQYCYITPWEENDLEHGMQ